MKEKRVAFMALIKKIESKSLVSGDKETYVTLAFDSSKALATLNALNELHRADGLVSVGIVTGK
jgi:hypothetical protein